ncbi:hypothetical protein [Candidatus Tisiphia endosymbiont of Nemotelus uliginosus]|uniref:hypothetical protein n=1 Tax=Candidatus Tisiphia endosymbiont of Nemotelus uliginosus TaxID=3077926 RepID=UPI0035C88C4F
MSTEPSLTPEDFYDTKLYRKWHIIERLFTRFKENKRITMRSDNFDCPCLQFYRSCSYLKLIIYFVNSAIGI